MTTDSKPEKNLSKNAIELFILKFDLQPIKEEDYNSIIDNFSKHFDRTEIRSQANYQFKLTIAKSEIDRKEGFQYVLINEKYGYSMTFATAENSFWFESKNYTDYNTYLEIISKLMEFIATTDIILVSKRIGMRYINKFKCDKIKDISKIFVPSISKSIIQRISQPNLARVINQEEFTFDAFRVRVQYGIPNKFYPSVLNNYDLLLDIDAFDNTLQEMGNWDKVMYDLNHVAYQVFESNITSSYLNSLK